MYPQELIFLCFVHNEMRCLQQYAAWAVTEGCVVIAKRSCYAQTQTAVFCFVLSVVFFFCLFVLSASLCLALVPRLGKSASGQTAESLVCTRPVGKDASCAGECPGRNRSDSQHFPWGPFRLERNLNWLKKGKGGRAEVGIPINEFQTQNPVVSDLLK